MDWQSRKEKEDPSMDELLAPPIAWHEWALYGGVLVAGIVVFVVSTRLIEHLYDTKPATAARQALITHGISVQPMPHAAINTLAVGWTALVILAVVYVRLAIRERRRGA